MKSVQLKHHWISVAAARATRDKETFFVQRATLGNVETEAIQRYIKKAAGKFETSWSAYENQLEKYLTSSNETRQFKDWMQRKDPLTNGLYWQNMQTLQTSFEHPGKKIFETNKKILRQKAEDELTDNLGSILERNRTIRETVHYLKLKVSTECATLRKSHLCL